MTKVPDDQGGTFTLKVYDEVVFAGSDGTPRMYKIHRETKRVIGDDANKLKEFEKMLGRVYGLKFDDDGGRFAAASSLDGKGQVRVYNVETGKFIACEKVTGPAYTVAWKPGGKEIASAGFDGTIWLHDAATGKLVKSFVVKHEAKVASGAQ